MCKCYRDPEEALGPTVRCGAAERGAGSGPAGPAVLVAERPPKHRCPSQTSPCKIQIPHDLKGP